MKKIISLSLLSLFILISPVIAEVLHKSSSGVSTIDPQKDVKSKIGLLKIPFIKNEAQINNLGVKYYANIISGNVFVADDSITYSLFNGTGSEVKGWIVKEKFIGSKKTLVEGIKESPAKVNFFKGKENENWKKNIPTYEVISFGEVYDHIKLDLKAYGKNIEKIFIVEKGGNPEDIAILIEGARVLKINLEGELELETGIGTLKMTTPLAFQEIDGKKVKVATAYDLKSSENNFQESRMAYGFKVGDYDKSKPLIIDPLPKPIDSTDHVYVVGYTGSSDFYTSGADEYNYGNQGNLDIFVAKLDNDLKNLIAIAFIGGNNNDYGNSITIDYAGNVYVAGYTNSNDFPTTPTGTTSYPPYDGSHNGGPDVFITKLNASLNTLLASTFIGGSNSDYANSISLDTSGNVYVTGWTLSIEDSPPSKIPFPKTAGVYDSPSHGGEDVFVAKLDSDLKNLLASTFFGGSNSDYAYSIAVNPNNNDVYLTGATASSDYPTTLGAFNTSHSGNLDVFISKLNSDLSSLLSSTFIGGTDHDVARAIAVSPIDDVYITGWTAGGYPTTAGAYNETHTGNLDVFVSKFNSNLSMLMASTFLGGADGDLASGIVIDWSGNIYVTGWTASSDFPTSDGSFDSTINGEQDVFVANLDGGLSTLLASTFIGGVSHDAANAIALDSTGMVFVAGYTNSSDFIPYQVEGYDKTYHNSWDSFVYRQRPDLSKVNMLTVTLPGDGRGTVMSSPSGISCGKCPEWDINCNQQEYNDCTEEYNREIKVTLTAEPSADSTFGGWTGGCDQILTGPNRCVVNVIAIKSIAATFRLTTFTISATTDLVFAGGSISPLGSVVVSYGGTQSFTITPDSSHYIGDVIVDGVSKGQISTYTFTNVTSDRTILAVFRAKPVIEATANTGGSISPSGSVVVSYGGSMSFSITPDTGNYISDVVVDGVSKGPITTYTFTNVISDRTIQAVFRTNPIIEATANTGGSISPSGSVGVNYGGSMSFTITPDSGNYLADVVVDGVSKGPITTYTFTNVISDRTILAIFRANPSIGLSAETGGTISPSGTHSVSYGSDLLITITPGLGYFVSNLLIDGVSIGPFAGYLLENITEDHTVTAFFSQEKPQGYYDIITTSGPGGIIKPYGINKVKPLKNKTFSIKPNKGYHIKDIVVDGQSKGPISRYSFTLVSASHTIEATFDTKKTLTITKAGAGQGKITSKPSGISCGNDCKQIYNTDNLVLLIPTPSSNSVFSGWSGGWCSGTDTCAVKMDDDITVTAIFSPK